MLWASQESSCILARTLRSGSSAAGESLLVINRAYTRCTAAQCVAFTTSDIKLGLQQCMSVSLHRDRSSGRLFDPSESLALKVLREFASRSL